MGHNNEFNLLSLNVFVGFALLKRGKLFLIGLPTYFSCKKHRALEILKISGENNGKAKCSSRMAAIIAEVL